MAAARYGSVLAEIQDDVLARHPEWAQRVAEVKAARWQRAGKSPENGQQTRAARSRARAGENAA